MPINTLEYSQIMQTQLDQQMIMGLTSGWMDANAGQVEYNGGAEVKIPTLSMQGLGDYDRDKGFVQGAVTLKYQTKTMTQDRGRTFHLDSQDVTETNFVANATRVASEFQRIQVIPEVDAYRYSKIFALLKAQSRVLEGFTPTAANVLDKLMEHITQIQDIIGADEEIVITMSTLTQSLLAEALKTSRRLDVGDFKKGEVNTKVKKLDDIPIIAVPSARLKTLYDSLDGETSGQEAGGMTPNASAKDINWIITPRRGPIAVVKQDTLRIFEPKINQKADAWKVDYRKYHDLWMMDEVAKIGFACSK